jgi:Holliday junction resolvase RusA-like endonuclease
MLKGIIRPTKKPDIDNVAKIILDSLNCICYKDDTQIVSLIVNKYYSQEPRVEVVIEGV